jgi:hypothetical protein
MAYTNEPILDPFGKTRFCYLRNSSVVDEKQAGVFEELSSVIDEKQAGVARVIRDLF